MGKQRKALTGFGTLVREFGERRGLYGAPAIADALSEIGYTSSRNKEGVSRTAVDGWMKGEQTVPKDVLPYMERLFELDTPDKVRLAWAYAWEQDFSRELAAA